MTIHRSTLLVFVFIFSLQGYTLIAALSNLLGLNNYVLSIVFRSCIVIASLFLLARTRWHVKQKQIIFCLILFWLFYFGRLFYTLISNTMQPNVGISTYWIWSVGVCFLPIMALLQLGSFSQDALRKLFQVTIGIYITGALLLYINLIYFGTANLIVNSRFELTSLNPITIGMSSGALLLFGFVLWSQWTSSSPKLPYFFFISSVIIISSLLLILSNSRGPQISLILSLLFWLLVGRKTVKPQTLIIVVLSASLFFTIGYLFRDYLDEYTEIRLLNIFSSSDPSTLTRIHILVSSFNVFLSSPIIGGGLVEPIYRSYSHNIIFDSLMGVGILGTILILIPIIYGVYKSALLIRSRHSCSWLALIYIYYLIASIFSGTIHNSVEFWVLLVSLIVVSNEAIQGTNENLAKSCGSIGNDRC